MMRFFSFLFFFFLVWVTGRGQTSPADTTALTASAANALASYDRLNTTRDRLYNGIENIPHNPRYQGHPYFDTDNWSPGLLQDDLNGTTTLPILYDLVRDVVVTEHSTGYRMAIRSDLIHSFTLLNHMFVRMTDSSRGLPTGFYDRLYDGPTQLLARRTKVVQLNSVANSRMTGLFDPKNTFYVLRQNHYYPVKTKRALLAVFEDQRKSLSTYARQQKLRFRPDPEPAILKLTQQYDELTRSTP